MPPKQHGKSSKKPANEPKRREVSAGNPFGVLSPPSWRAVSKTLSYSKAMPNRGSDRNLAKESTSPSTSSRSTLSSISPGIGEFGVMSGGVYSPITSSAGRSRETPPPFADVATSPGFGLRPPPMAQQPVSLTRPPGYNSAPRPKGGVRTGAPPSASQNTYGQQSRPSVNAPNPPAQQSTYGLPPGYQMRYDLNQPLPPRPNPPRPPPPPQQPTYMQQPPTSSFGPQPLRPPQLAPILPPLPRAPLSDGTGATNPSNFMSRQPSGQGQRSPAGQGQPSSLGRGLPPPPPPGYGPPNTYGRGQPPFGRGW